MDIVLNTIFNNPNLPIIPVPGFHDNFNRAASSTLGTTDDGKEWNFFGFVPWKITANGTATGLGSGQHAAVDALTADGTLSVKVAKAATAAADKRAGLLFRMTDRDNYYYLCPNTSGVLTLYGRVGAALTVNKSFAGVIPITGDTLAVVLSGAQVVIKVNGATVGTETLPELVAATLHGLYSNASSDAEWDSVEFIPA